jgi:hypothetical protein
MTMQLPGVDLDPDVLAVVIPINPLDGNPVRPAIT